MRKFFILLCACALVVLVIVLTGIRQKTTNPPSSAPVPEQISATSEISMLTVGRKTIRVEIANTPDSRTQGLSGRASLAADHGLLFVFEKPDKHGFWMKDMNFPIDMIWIDANKKVIHIEKNVQPASYPHIYMPPTPALYVLEVVAGFSERNTLEVGDSVTF